MGSSRKRIVVLGSVRLPLWLYLCITLFGTFILSFVASGGMKYIIVETHMGAEHTMLLELNWTWFGVVIAVCAASLMAVAAGAILRHKVLVSQDDWHGDARNQRTMLRKDERSTVA